MYVPPPPRLREMGLVHCRATDCSPTVKGDWQKDTVSGLVKCYVEPSAGVPKGVCPLHLQGSLLGVSDGVAARGDVVNNWHLSKPCHLTTAKLHHKMQMMYMYVRMYEYIYIYTYRAVDQIPCCHAPPPPNKPLSRAFCYKPLSRTSV